MFKMTLRCSAMSQPDSSSTPMEASEEKGFYYYLFSWGGSWENSSGIGTWSIRTRDYWSQSRGGDLLRSQLVRSITSYVHKHAP